MSRQYAVFSDIDYTIVFDSEIAPMTHTLIEQVRQRAHFVLVTARSMAECAPLPSIPNDGLAAENGAAVYLRHGSQDLLDADWDAVMQRRQRNLVQFRESLAERGWRINRKLHAFSSCIESSGKTEADIQWAQETLPEGLRLEFSRNTAGRYIEVFPEEAGKDKAVERLCGRLGVSPGHTLGLGDNTNDLSMLQAVAVPLCPGNAHPDVKRQVTGAGGYVSAESGHAGAQDILREVLDRLTPRA